MNQKNKLPFLLSILLYSLLLLALLILVVFALLSINQYQFAYLLDAYSSRSFEFSLLTQLYTPFLFIIIYIVSIILMILTKKIGYYLFYLLNLFLVVVLILHPPIHFLNISVIILINLIIFWQFSSYEKTKLKQELVIIED